MDIFKGIGDFFGGLFGQKKKREDEQPQPQQQQSAVSFNSTPKLGDNFANNASNPTQPQQPKEFAKSSVDLNPVKPVQPVQPQPQPQPQVNHDQERQQLANQYRQEETDRYNQGSDHAANFLNDIFSGGKTAQMRENTINQNIQNRVNAEMLRKYGPDDQQVKQNIAQTSQDINNKATSVNDFTKNYNNTVQQTVASPVSAVKGAANSVVETMPKVSGAVTELGANTIKLFDEDNQFANNLINRVRADREKNIVRKTLNSATGLTDQDNKMAYGLGSSGTRMAIDAAMTPVTGGVAPALVHGVEAHSEMMDSLDNIEARKKAEAAAKGEVYTPSSFTSRYLASTANAGAQAAIEKLGIDNVTGKIGGKFAKNMVGRAVTGALGEAGEEAAQQYAENFTKKLFDNKQNIHEGVAESALMGGIMGGAGKMAFGGMDSVKNPYKSSDMADGEVSISKLHPDQMSYNKDAVLGKFTGDTRKRMSERSFNMLQDLRANNPYMTGDGQEIHLSGRGNKKFVNTQAGTDAEFIAKMRSTPRINELIQNSEYSHTSPDTKNHGIAPDGFDYRDVNFKYGGKDFNTTFNVARNNTINRNTLYGATTKENISTPGLRDNPSTKSYADVYGDSIAQNPQNVNGSALNDSKIKEEPELSGFYTRSNSSSYDSNIAQNVNDFNRQYEPEIQDLQNAYQKYGDDFEFNLTPEQQATYEHLLRESPRDSEGRYIDPATGEVTIDQIVEDSQGKYVKGEVNELFDVSNKKLPSATKKYLENLQDSQFNTAHGTVKNHPDMPGKYVYGERLNASDLKDKLKIAPQLDEILEATEWAKDSNGKIRNVLNQDGKHPEIDNWNYGKVRYEPANSNRQYEAVVNVGTNENGNHFYSLDKTKRLAVPHEGGLSTQQASSDSNIAQNAQKVNRMQPFEPTERTPLVNGDRDFGGSFGNGFDPRGENSAVNKDTIPEAETNQKTRKFAETVLDTDTPPKDFVKLMHAGDESLKYTPKKNSEMWSRATKSVQESPERVFNELENTRVANDETMAKGIALAKHYQAMGDDLKASELYVELAKKATEAGRTVQALNLMRRTTPEGVLMSTMREVESYNDKMKNKPNKQINITPEQRAEFLGRLREAYAMPEGN